MSELKITVRDKIATADGQKVVCGNSDYRVHFDLDAEWSAYSIRTMRVVYHDHSYTDMVFVGDVAPLPVVENQSVIRVGLFAGNLHTTTPAIFPCELSITSGTGSPKPPAPDVYAQIMSELNDLDERVDELEEGGTGGTVKSVNGKTPDEAGNVVIPIPDPPDLSGYAKSQTVSDLAKAVDESLKLAADERTELKEDLDALDERVEELEQHGTGGGIPDAPIDGKQYARKDGAWSEVQSGTSYDDTAIKARVSAIEAKESGWNAKQDAITDLATIRSGAALGATALQSVPNTYRTAAQQDIIDNGKQPVGDYALRNELPTDAHINSLIDAKIGNITELINNI